jgi:hypothetical protein
MSVLDPGVDGDRARHREPLYTPRVGRDQRVEQGRGLRAQVRDRVGKVVGRGGEVDDAADRVPLPDVGEGRRVGGVQRLDDDALVAGQELRYPGGAV